MEKIRNEKTENKITLTIGIAIAIGMIIMLTLTACGHLKDNPTPNETAIAETQTPIDKTNLQVMRVDFVDYETDTVFWIDCIGREWYTIGCDDWFADDLAIVEIENEEIIDCKFAGWKSN